jgi:WD40 repeat protein
MIRRKKCLLLLAGAVVTLTVAGLFRSLTSHQVPGHWTPRKVFLAPAKYEAETSHPVTVVVSPTGKNLIAETLEEYAELLDFPSLRYRRLLSIIPEELIQPQDTEGFDRLMAKAKRGKVRWLEYLGYSIGSVTISGDGKWVAGIAHPPTMTAEYSPGRRFPHPTVFLWNSSDFPKRGLLPLRAIQFPELPFVSAVQFPPNSDHLWVWAFPELRIYDPGQGSLLDSVSLEGLPREWQGQDTRFFGADRGAKVITYDPGSAKTVFIYSVPSGRLMRRMDLSSVFGDAPSHLYNFAASPDGRWVAVYASQNWHLISLDGSLHRVLPVEPPPIRPASAFSPSGGLFVFQSLPCVLSLFSLHEDKIVGTYRVCNIPGLSLTAVVFSTDAEWLVVAGAVFDGGLGHIATYNLRDLGVKPG